MQIGLWLRTTLEVGYAGSIESYHLNDSSSRPHASMVPNATGRSFSSSQFDVSYAC